MSLVHAWGAQYTGKARMNDEATGFKEVSEHDLLRQLLDVLRKYVGERGDSEGAVEVLRRLIRERDEAVYCWEFLTGEKQIVPGLTPDLLAARNVFACWHNAGIEVLKMGMPFGENVRKAWERIVNAAKTYDRDKAAVGRVLGLEPALPGESYATRWSSP